MTQRQVGAVCGIWAEDGSVSQLLWHYRELIENVLFPRLKQSHVYEPLRRETEKRFEAAGYGVATAGSDIHCQAADAGGSTALILVKTISTRSAARSFNVAVYLKRELAEDINLPRWFEGLLRAVAYDERIAAQPVAYLV